jgi:multidrug efflux system outer membrane protein
MRLILASLILILLSISCTPRRNYETPEPPDVGELHEVVSKQRFDQAEPVGEWWTLFDDATLGELVERGLEHNLDIRAGLQRLREARAELRESGFDRYPTVTAQGSAATIRDSEEVVPNPDPTYELYDVGFDAFWEIDLFGRVSQRIALAEARQQESIAELRGVYVTIAAEIARNYMLLRGAQYRLDVARRNEKNQADTFDLIKVLADGGRSNDLDVSRAATNLARTRAAIPPLEAQLESAIHAISVLVGKEPHALKEELTGLKPLPSLPPTIQIGNAADLLKRRMDITIAEQRYAQTVAQYNLEATDIFPTISIAGMLGFSATSLSDLVSGDALRYRLGPQIRWSAFDIGRQRAQLEAADAESVGVLLQYEATVLGALQEVADSMAAFSYEAERRDFLQDAAKASADAARLARLRYEAGLDNFLDVLDAERTLLETELELAQSEVNLATGLVALYKALGGGWQGQPIEVEAE